MKIQRIFLLCTFMISITYPSYADEEINQGKIIESFMKERSTDALPSFRLHNPNYYKAPYPSLTEPYYLDRDYNLLLLDVKKNQKQIASFNGSIKEHKLKGEIIACRRFIDVPVGAAHGNHSFGGTCLYKDNEDIYPVHVCNDEMVGHFNLEKTNSESSILELA